MRYDTFLGHESGFADLVGHIRSYVAASTDPEVLLVGERMLGEIGAPERYPGMRFLAAMDAGGRPLAVTNSMAVSRGGSVYGVHYHALSLDPKTPAGGFAFRRELGILIAETGIAIAKPETRSGEMLLGAFAFGPRPDLDDLLFWEGTSYACGSPTPRSS